MELAFVAQNLRKLSAEKVWYCCVEGIRASALCAELPTSHRFLRFVLPLTLCRSARAVRTIQATMIAITGSNTMYDTCIEVCN